MALATYADLQDAIAGWLNRQDLTARIPDFVRLCEADMQRRLKNDAGMVSTTTISTVSGAAALPDDLAAIITLKGEYKLDYRTMDTIDNYNATSGTPSEYGVIGGTVYVYPQPLDGYSLTLRYRQKLDLIRYGPNWVLDNHPDVYLFGSLVHAEPYIVEDERVPLWRAQYEQVLNDIMLDGMRQTTGGKLQLQSNGPRN